MADNFQIRGYRSIGAGPYRIFEKFSAGPKAGRRRVRFDLQCSQRQEIRQMEKITLSKLVDVSPVPRSTAASHRDC